MGVNVLVSYDDDVQSWVAHCLELDFVEDGTSRIKAIKHLLSTMSAQLAACLEDGMDFIQLAPSQHWKEWQLASPFILSEDIDASSPHFKMIVHEATY